MERILVGVDGSAAAETAMRWASEISERTGASILALHAYERPFAEIAPYEHELLLNERRALLDEEWARIPREAGISVETRLDEGDPRSVVVEVVEAERPDLVVLGRSGRGGGPGFMHLGSVVEHVAHHTDRPLAVISSNGLVPIRRIVLGVDGSAESLAAVAWCAAFAGAVGADVTAVAIEEPILEWTPSWDDRNWRRDIERDARAWVAPLSDAGIAVDMVVSRDMHPADGLLGIASARGADLLVVGTRGAGGFLGLRFGGVAMKILHRASLPLVVVPPSAER